MGSEPRGGNPNSLDDVTISLTDFERDSMRQELGKRAIAPAALPLDDEELLTEAQLAGGLLPDRVLRTLCRFRRRGDRAGAVLLRNLPTDQQVPATPGSGFLAHWNELPVATFAQLAVTSVIGDVIAYADEKAGNLVQDIVPLEG